MRLSKINSPDDLKKVSLIDLPGLAQELREYIINHVSVTGGHLAPSLGAVDLTIALHYIFDTPRDKIIWDVGHQAYAHKILTGRREEFPKNRQYQGISGFPNPKESPHDAFGTGHASTSISAGYGMVCARDLTGEKYNVISVIGDGSMTGGLAFEGLNNAGASKRNFIVVLNDNTMSISPNVGALSKYLALLITNPHLNKIKRDLLEFANRIPQGDRIARSWGRLENSIKAMLAPGMFFEQLGFRYIGPLDGHKIDDLVNIFQKVKELPGPILIHVLTKKGKGYQPAENDATHFHGVGSFSKTTGQANGKSKNPSYTSIFGKTLVSIAKERKDVIAITAAMTDGTGLTEFSKLYPDRFFDVGIAESHAVTFASGLAVQGLRPVVAIYSTFLQRAYDQIIHDVALQNIPVIFALDRAGLVGEDGPTHHGCFDLSYLRNIPNLTVLVPRDENEFQHMIATAIEWKQGPIAVRYPRGAGVGCVLDQELQPLPVGKAEVARTGNSGAILTLGPIFWEAMQAAQMLDEKGIPLSVINMRSLKPLDLDLLKQISVQFDRVITVEEGILAGGFGSAVMEAFEKMEASAPMVKRLGIKDEFIEQGSRSILLKNVGLDAENIARQASEFFSKSGEKPIIPKAEKTAKIDDIRDHSQHTDTQDMGRSSRLPGVAQK
ncbi:1-deoxy-D-xylulose-5-phosphate synthase [candidate division LCP-89 bacterium B3_LCP]|uniref:1-deoxy-D-xylulose-5-phosphate synthase n=1 Tax=candidate division LCP-89 bacterium B3_LCP TaxID=2012998 RepID=A0A532V2T5_UNCL8|nr:MAG: 1-deoxy-D-xylulose-5-phosphate synthase [candidate division LCP-89 bacterium B3_LCP]